MIARARIRVDSESFAHDALPFLLQFVQLGLDAALLIQRALTLGNDHFRAFLLRRERFFQDVAHGCQVIRPRDRPHPFHADPADGIRDGQLSGANWITGFGGKNVLAARRRGVTVVDDDQYAVALVEYGIAHPAGQPVMPETSVAHKADGALAGFFRVQSGRASPTQAIAHRRGADTKRRQRRKKVTPYVAANVM